MGEGVLERGDRQVGRWWCIVVLGARDACLAMHELPGRARTDSKPYQGGRGVRNGGDQLGHKRYLSQKGRGAMLSPQVGSPDQLSGL